MRQGRARRRGASAAARGVAATLAAVSMALPAPVGSQEPPPRVAGSYNLFGVTGLVDTPTARVQPDGQLGVTVGWFGPFLRTTLNFQVLPRVEGTFRYSALDNFFAGEVDLFDRSFDVKILLSDETRFTPAVAFGLQDFLGTGVYSGEYFVGTKSFGEEWTVSGGLGWGRFSGQNGFDNPFCTIRAGFCTRPGFGATGQVQSGNFFRGEDVALFGGVEWRPRAVPGLVLKAEYSSDDYSRDREFNGYDMEIPFNFGIEYDAFDTLQLGAYAMHGTTVGLRATVSFNPLRPLAVQDADQGPLPLRPRPMLPERTDPALGPVLERLTPEPAVGSDARVADAALAAVASARWAEARVDAAAGDACPVAAALEVDAQLGVVDGVTLRAADGAAVCSVVLRPRGRDYVAERTEVLGDWDVAWIDDPAQVEAARRRVAETLAADRLDLERLELSARGVRIEIANPTYNAAPQAIGRTATALANELPPSIEDFEIVLVEGSLPVVSVKLERARLETVAETPDEARDAWLSAEVTDAVPSDGFAPLRLDESFPRFDWYLSPRVPVSLFDPDNPFRADLALALGGEVEVARGLSLSGEVTKRVVGNLDQIRRTSDSVLPRVRSDFAQYLREGDPGLTRLTADWVAKLSPDTYGRLSAGYLEAMFGGVSGEVLWKPVAQDWGLGVEVNYVMQRDFDMRFGFQDYDIATGHASLYWDTGWHDMEVQVDAGRYLAGDWGGTFGMTRRFSNGWEVGGFFTLTDVPFDEFGEGSFDKGLTLRIPLRWGLPYETRSAYSTTIRPIQRDGGARLEVANRLYQYVQDLDRQGLRDDWGNFWR